MRQLSEFNGLSPEAADQLLRPCLDIDRWVQALVGHRPYGGVDELTDVARRAADPFTDEETEQAIVAEQLRQIALLRLSRAVAP